MNSDAPLAIESTQGKAPRTRIFHVTGPITLTNVFAFQDALRSGDLPRVAILDLSNVPYLDSAGMGAIVNYYVHCRRNSVNMIAAGVNARALELFVLTKVHSIIPMAATLDDAEGLA